MLPEPERPIEKLLRDSAQARREQLGADLELHPATRRWLQAEVTRQYGAGTVATRPGWWNLASFWPRLAWGAATTVALALAVWLVTPGTQNTAGPLLAKSDSTVRLAVLPQPPPAPVRSLTLAQSEAAKSSVLEKVEPAQQPVQAARGAVQANANAPAPAPVGGAPAAAPPAPEQALTRYGLAGSPASARAPATPSLPAPPEMSTKLGLATEREALSSANPAATETSPTGVAPALAAAQAWARTGTGGPSRSSRAYFGTRVANEVGTRLVQRFVRAPAAKTSSGNAQPPRAEGAILASFQVEQTGPELRVIDDDGSVYTGSVQASGAPLTSAGATGGLLQKAAPTGEANRQAAVSTRALKGAQRVNGYAFQVSGTNRTTQQQVIFSGNLISAADTAGAARASGGRVAAQGAATTPLLLNARIAGTAVVGPGQMLRIDAVPASR